MTLEYIHPDELHKHLENVKLYGDTPDQELVESVKQHGVFEDHPIGYVMDGDFRRIVSGHRRHQAARLAKCEMVPVVRLTELEGDDLAIREHLVLSNKHRNKSNEILAREAAFLEAICSERAASRMQQGTSLDPSLLGDEGSRDEERGRTDEIVGEKLGVGKKKARSLIAAGKALNEAESKGQERKAERIKKGLKKSAAAGAEAAKPKPAKNGSVVQTKFDDKAKFDKPIGILRRSLDERLEAFPAGERHFNKCKYALNQFLTVVLEWRDDK
jgi:ParB-like chromosome segregation protein Spo0J